MKIDMSNDLVIRKLMPGDRQYYCMAINPAEKGFGVLVYPTGGKTFIFRYQLDGSRKLLALGEYSAMTLKDARDEYLKAKVQITDLRKGRADGVDPVLEIKMKAERRVEATAERQRHISVAKLITEYIEKHAMKKKRSWQKDQAILNRDILPLWGDRKAKDVTRRDIGIMTDGIISRGSPIMANLCFAITRKMFNYAVEKDILQSNPCTGLKLPSERNQRTRTLSEIEIRTLFASLDNADLNMSVDTRTALKLILYTAQRPGEVVGMRAKEIDGHWWTLPPERTKNKRTHRVYLTDTALELIGDTTGKDHIFKSPHHDKLCSLGDTALAGAVHRNLNYPMTDVKGRPLYTKDGKPATENRLGIEEHFTPHDMRRSAATLLAKCKVRFEHRERVLNHTMGILDGVYNQHDFDDEKQLAMETLERKIASILSGTTSAKVIQISREAM